MFKREQNDKQMKRLKGFTLIELLLVVGVIALLSLFITNVFETMAIRAANQRIAKQMLEVQQAAEYYVARNFDTILTTLPLAGDIAEYTITDIKNDDFLPATYSENNRFGQNITVFVRNLGDAFSEGDTLEVLTVSEDPGVGDPVYIENLRLREIANAGGAKLGYSSELITAGEIASSANRWQVNRADFEAAGYLITPDADEGGYLASYGRVSIADIAGDEYLYKVQLDSVADANLMEANLDMNNYNIENVSALTVDRMEVSGNTVIEGNDNETSNNALSVSQMAEFLGASNQIRMAADGTDDCAFNGARDNVTGTTCSIVGGNLLIEYESATQAGLLVADNVDVYDIEAAIADPNYEGAVIADTGEILGAGNTAITFTSADFQDVVVNGGGAVEAGKITTRNLTMGGAGQEFLINNAPIQIVGNDSAGSANTFQDVNAAGLLAVQTEVLAGNVDVQRTTISNSLVTDGNLTVQGVTTASERMSVNNKIQCNKASDGTVC